MTKINITKNIFIVACLFGVSTVTAQFSQTAKIVSENREGRAEYGTSVALSENFAVVGASRENIASGAAYVYSKDMQGNWSYAQRLAADDPNNGAEYGGGMKFSDDYLVVAAGRADLGNIQRTGALYVYDYDNSNWELSTKLVASDYSSDAKMGMNPTSLDVQRNTIVAGAPGENAWTGSVYVFTKEAGVWTETQKIMSPTPQASNAFGIGVSISGDYMVIGAHQANNSNGEAYVYINNNGTWEYDQTLVASDGAFEDYFGSTVSLAGDQLVIGSYNANAAQGAAYVFEKNSNESWVEVQKLNANPSTEETHFGWTTTIRKDYIVVTAPHIYEYEPGEVYFYKRETSGMWVEDQIIQGEDTEGEDFYGWSVDMYEDELIIGAPREDHDANGNNEIGDAGSAYIFKDPSLLGRAYFENTNNDIRMYPNPTQSSLSIECQSKTIINYSVYGINGVLLQEVKNVNNRLITLNISNYSMGVYFVKVTLDDASTVIQKIIKN